MSGRKVKPEELRSRQWFNNPDDAEMTALYTERYLNYGLTREELRDGRPIIALAQTGSDPSPCLKGNHPAFTAVSASRQKSL